MTKKISSIQLSILFLLVLIVGLVLFLYNYDDVSAKNEPNYLLYEAKGTSWNAIIEIKQSGNKKDRFLVKERHYIKYIGKEVNKLYKEQNPVQWEIDSILSTQKNDTNFLSQFQKIIGTPKGGFTIENNSSSRLANKKDEFKIKVKWDNNKEENLILKCVKWK